MKKASLLALSLIFFSCSAFAHDWGTLDEMIASCGTYFHEQQLAKDQGQRTDVNGLIFMHSICRESPIYSKLDLDQKTAITRFDDDCARERSKLSREKLEENDRFIAQLVRGMQSRNCTADNPSMADSEVRQTWLAMCNALQKNDIEEALGYFHEGTRDKYRRSFAQMGKESLQRAGTDMQKDMIKGRIDGNEAIYQLFRLENGNRYSYELKFFMDENCQWKVYSF